MPNKNISSKPGELSTEMLIMIKDRKTITEIANWLDKSVSTIHEWLEYLIQEGLVVRSKRYQHRGRMLTEKGKELIKDYHE